MIAELEAISKWGQVTQRSKAAESSVVQHFGFFDHELASFGGF